MLSQTVLMTTSEAGEQRAAVPGSAGRLLWSHRPGFGSLSRVKMAAVLTRTLRRGDGLTALTAGSARKRPWLARPQLMAVWPPTTAPNWEGPAPSPGPTWGKPWATGPDHKMLCVVGDIKHLTLNGEERRLQRHVGTRCGGLVFVYSAVGDSPFKSENRDFWGTSGACF